MITMALIIPLTWLLKSFAYRGLFRWRTIVATATNCLVIAGSPFLLSIVALPALLGFPAAIGLAIFLTMHYTGVDPIPDGLFIPLGIELLFFGSLWVIQNAGLL